MRVYYNPSTGKVTHTVLFAAKGAELPGSYIEVPDDTVVEPHTAFEVQNGQLVLVDLSKAVDQKMRTVNAAVGRARSKYITVIPGQEMIYLKKEAEARDFLSRPQPPSDAPGWEANFPFIAGEIGATGATASDVANTIVSLADSWYSVGSALESLRLTTKSDLEAATTQAEIDAVMQAFNTALEAF